MLKSMTACAVVADSNEMLRVEVEMRSVNSRYLDLRLNLPALPLIPENEVRSLIADKIKRGKIEVKFTIRRKMLPADKTTTDPALMQQKLSNLTVEQCIRLFFNQMVQVEEVTELTAEQEADFTELWHGSLQKCINDFVQAREREGEKLARDILARLDALSDYLPEIKEINRTTPANDLQALKERLQLLLKDTSVENYNERLYCEIALLADKHDATEEITRLESHLTELRRLCFQNTPVGKEMDFLLQEVNREVNTLGSKANNIRLTQLVVLYKTELEKIREQVQNIE